MLDPKENREIWMRGAVENKDLLEKRASEDIEKYRKGYAKIKVIGKDGKPLSGKKVKVTQKTHDFKYGANIFMLDEFNEPEYCERYRENFKKYFNLATVPFYWKDLEPVQGKPRYAKDSPKVWRRPAPDLCLEYCEENGLAAKLHCLVYEAWTPDWVPRQDMAAMEKLYAERFRQIAERYSGRLMEFEVVNELLIEDGWSKDVKTVVSERPDVVEWAFDLARKYFPNETLVFNEAPPLMEAALKDYRCAYYLLLENSLLKGVDFDKIGIQHHDFRGAMTTTDEEYEKDVKSGGDMFDPKKLLDGLDVFANLGLPMELTEVTIPTFGESEEDEKLQADLLEVFYTCCFSHPAVDTVVYWNVPDGYAWDAPGRLWNENKCKGGLFHHDITPKKSAERLYELFNKRWHTELEVETDKGGYADFRGFYGEYEIEIDGEKFPCELHKDEAGVAEIML